MDFVRASLLSALSAGTSAVELVAMLQVSNRSSDLKTEFESKAHADLQANLLQSTTHLINSGTETTHDDVKRLHDTSKGVDTLTPESVLDLVMEIILSEMDTAHTDDQGKLNAKCSTINACQNMKIRKDSDIVQPFKEDLDDVMSQHRACRGVEQDLNTTEAALCADQVAWHGCTGTYSGDKCWRADKPSQSGLSDSSTVWTIDSISTWKDKVMKCTDAGTNRTAQREYCNTLQIEVEGDYCIWYALRYSMWTDYETCWDDHNYVSGGVSRYAELLKDIRIREAARKHQFVALMQIRCTFRMMHLGAANAFSTCQSTNYTTDQTQAETFYNINVCIHHDKLVAPPGEGLDIPAPGDGHGNSSEQGYAHLMSDAEFASPHASVIKC